ncbi:MAG: hypothetical protein J7L69_11715 [Desulfobulbaceae bacterium]|nr:hypothetical protein [Desulfobulbaceae bacterium]
MVYKGVKIELEQAGIQASIEILIKDGDPVTYIAQTANEKNISSEAFHPEFFTVKLMALSISRPAKYLQLTIYQNFSYRFGRVKKQPGSP